jgi:hypothetical protein
VSLDVYLYREASGAPDDDGDEMFWANITHNLGRMADEAGIYRALWRPDENGITTAAQMIDPLRAGLSRLEAEPEHFKQFNASNGWGMYEHFVPFVRRVLEACQEYPTALVRVSR